MRGAALSIVLALPLLGLGPGHPAAAARADPPVRIMVLGDSVSQGSAGDWTWRFRLAQHLAGEGVAFDLVGPRTDLFDNVTGQQGGHAYVDPAFDQDHASMWGLSLAFLSAAPPVGIGWTVQGLVSTFHPDVVVELLGVNDLAFLGEEPAGVAGLVHDVVDDARSVEPDVDVVLTRLPMTWVPGVPAFNDLLDDLSDEVDSASSRVVVAAADAGYLQTEDTWDGAHPDSHGELKIAAAVEDALATLGVGTPADRPLPDVARGPRIPPLLTAQTSTSSVRLTWVRSPGATESQVWLRDVSARGRWQLVAPHETGTTWSVAGLAGRHHLQLRVVPVKGMWAAAEDAWSDVVDVETLGGLADLSARSARGSRGPGSGRPGAAAGPGHR